jgi:hypothetical protein
MKNFKPFILLFVSLFLITSCNEDEDFNLPVPNGNTTVFDLNEKAVTGISSKATFVENEDASITLVLDISGTPANGVHPAHIHFNSALEGGAIALSFNPVDGNNGKSVTTFTTLNDGTPVSYNDMINFDGYINVHLSEDDLGTIVAQGDIGQNDLTGNTTTYDLGEKAVPGISGNVVFSERVNGESLATIMLSNTPANGSHPAHIHANTAAEGGGILFSFNPVDGDTGMSMTNVAAYDNGGALTYTDLAGLDAYVNVHLSATQLSTIVAQGNIGSNI